MGVYVKEIAQRWVLPWLSLPWLLIFPAVEAIISQQFLLYSPSSYGLRNMKKEFGNIASLVCTQTHIKEKTNRYFKDRAVSLDWCGGLLQHCRPERCPGGDPHCRGQSTVHSKFPSISNLKSQQMEFLVVELEALEAEVRFPISQYKSYSNVGGG